MRGGKRTETGPAALVKALGLMGVLARHWLHGRRCHHCGRYVLVNTEAGWPDLEIFMPGGKILFIEFKGRSRKVSDAETLLSSAQKERVAELRSKGFDVLVTSDHEEAMRYVNDAKTGERHA